jgi:N-acetylneuraminate synthase
MLADLHIGERRIGAGHPCYVIAEAGSNHNGSYEQALALIDVAVEAGCDAVKFQVFSADQLYAPEAGRSDYLGDERSIYDIIKAMELPAEWLPKLADYCKLKGIESGRSLRRRLEKRQLRADAPAAAQAHAEQGQAGAGVHGYGDLG